MLTVALHPPGRSGRVRRLAPLDFPSVDTSAPGVAQRHARVEADKARQPPRPPVNADESRWDDPEDAVRTRSPKQVRGFRRGDVLGTMHRRGTDVTRDHLDAAQRFRHDWDVARVGLSGSDPMAERVGGSAAGPVLGPKAHEVARLSAQREVDRVMATIGAEGWPLLHWVVVLNGDVAAWVRANAAAPWPHDRKLDSKKEFGKLLHMLSRLAEHYGIDSRRDELKRIRKELSQP